MDQPSRPFRASQNTRRARVTVLRVPESGSMWGRNHFQGCLIFHLEGEIEDVTLKGPKRHVSGIGNPVLLCCSLYAKDTHVERTPISGLPALSSPVSWWISHFLLYDEGPFLGASFESRTVQSPSLTSVELEGEPAHFISFNPKTKEAILSIRGALCPANFGLKPTRIWPRRSPIVHAPTVSVCMLGKRFLASDPAHIAFWTRSRPQACPEC